jgi:site-specific recombinase XerD
MGQVVELKSGRRNAPTTEKGTVPPARRPNAELRTREHLTEREIARLMKAAGDNRWGQRDAAMILVAYRHALRASELVGLRWSDVELDRARLQVRRLKGSISGAHPMEGDEVRALRRLSREAEGAEFVFTSERGAPFTTAGFRKMLARVAEAAGLAELRVHPHMLRHATGYALANKGLDTRTLQAFMGHANIQNTVTYTALDAGRFKGIWQR